MSFFSQPLLPLPGVRPDPATATRRRAEGARQRKIAALRAKWSAQQIEDEEIRLAAEVLRRIEKGDVIRLPPADEDRRRRG
ncbi:hypothetical protein [Thioclava sediminum]|uniref:hypothetical protein n=1 Tax=Thioclava sediminum TaxID=1915319 RepID=UPI0011BA5762|nr:hypothetical protein [Thioclava sediminum]